MERTCSFMLVVSFFACAVVARTGQHRTIRAPEGKTLGVSQPTLSPKGQVAKPVRPVPGTLHGGPGSKELGKTPESMRYQKDQLKQIRREVTYHFRLGKVSVGTLYSHFSGPFRGYPYQSFPYYSYYWDPFWAYSRPFFASSYFLGYAPAPGKGQLRLSVNPEKANVFLDGGFAGTADRLRSMWLEPGTYDLVVTAERYSSYRQRISVRSRRTVKISAILAPLALARTR